MDTVAGEERELIGTSTRHTPGCRLLDAALRKPYVLAWVSHGMTREGWLAKHGS